MDYMVTWYHKKIGEYDLQIWEKAVELEENKQGCISRYGGQESLPKAEMIDLDLVKGSTFSKNKAQCNVLATVWIGIVRQLLLPVYHQWWIQQTSFNLFLVYFLMYVTQGIVLYLYLTGEKDDFEEIPTSGIAVPCLLMQLVALIHCQVVSTQFKYSISAPNRGRTLSSALLEPVNSECFEQTLTYVKASVANKENRSSTDQTKSSVKPASLLTSTSLEAESRGCNSSQDGQFWDDAPDYNYASDSSDASSDDSCVESLPEGPIKIFGKVSASNLLPGNTSTNTSVNRINVRIWENEKWQKVDVSLVEIGSLIMKKVHAKLTNKSDQYCFLSCIFVVLISFLPVLYQLVNHQGPLFHSIYKNTVWDVWNKKKLSLATIVLGTFMQRFVFSFVLFVMLCAAQRTYQKVQNIKVWLSLRSYLRRRGPQRSVDVIVSSAFCCSVGLLCFTTFQLMNSPETFMSSMLYWDCLVLLLALTIFLLHFFTVGAKINKNYSNISVILTEQINLYLQMDKTPLKKEQLQLVNSVLTNATKLIKEIETPYSIYGLAMNPLLYNITRVVILSAFSGVMNEMLGFKLKGRLEKRKMGRLDTFDIWFWVCLIDYPTFLLDNN